MTLEISPAAFPKVIAIISFCGSDPPNPRVDGRSVPMPILAIVAPLIVDCASLKNFCEVERKLSGPIAPSFIAVTLLIKF